MFLPELGSFVAAMLFAVHPIHTEAVRNIFYYNLIVIFTKSNKHQKRCHVFLLIHI